MKKLTKFISELDNADYTILFIVALLCGMLCVKALQWMFEGIKDDFNKGQHKIK